VCLSAHDVLCPIINVSCHVEPAHLSGTHAIPAHAQALLMPRTILCGHSLENDLRALRLLHGRCIDTVAAYPHPQGLPHKCALRKLAQTCALLLLGLRTCNGLLWLLVSFARASVN
jgi:hypothetical protein